jgi:hypothetical protein
VRGQIVCVGPERHTFYVAHQQQCPDCRFGFLVFLPGSIEATCEACGEPQPLT